MRRKLARYFFSLVFKNIVTFVLILLLVVLPLVYVYLKDVEDLVSQRIAVQLEMVAELGNFLLDGKEIALIQNPIWYETREYTHLVTTLGELQRNFGVDNAVVWRRRPDGRFEYVADGNRQFRINERVTLHDNFPGTYEAANAAWTSGRVDNTRLFQSGQSKWFQVNMPIMAGDDVVAVLMLNKFATPVAVAIAQRQGRIVVGMAIALIGGIFIWWFLTSRRLRPLIRLTDATGEIAAGNLDLELPRTATKSEIGTLSRAFGKMIEDLRASRAEIEEYNRTLERRIAERTREIRRLLDNMDEGIFSIDAEGHIASGYSEATERMLGPVGPDTNFLEILAPDPEQRKLVQETFQLLLKGDFLVAWDDMVANLPAEFSNAEGRYLRAHFRPVHDESGERVERVMVILSDISTEKALQEDAESNRALRNMVVQVISNRESYELFHKDALTMLRQADALLDGLETVKRGVIDEVFRSMHTIKGTAAVFGLESAAEKAHAIEDQLRALGEWRDTPMDPEVRDSLLLRLRELRDDLGQQRNRFLEMTGEDEQEPGYRIPESKLEAVVADVLELVPPQAAPRIRTALGRLKRVPTARLLRKYKGMVESLGSSLGKQVCFELEEPEPTEVPTGFFQRIDPTFLHIIRNAVDHGVEPPEQRLAAGKSAEAHVRITAAYRGEGLLFNVSDDGGGVDVERIRQVARERGVLTPESASRAGREELLRLLFEPRFSSRDEVTDLSGRGVGLDVVKHDVERMGGMMRLSTRKGRGTTFQLYYPLPA